MTNSPFDNLDGLTAQLRFVEERVRQLEQTVHRLSERVDLYLPQMDKRRQTNLAEVQSQCEAGLPIEGQKQEDIRQPASHESSIVQRSAAAIRTQARRANAYANSNGNRTGSQDRILLA